MTRLLTYNVHRCLGVDGILSPERIVEVIASCAPDIVALQELDVGRERTGGIDQALVIADLLGMDRHFHAALRVMEEQYGDAILTGLPSRLVKAGPLPGLVQRPLIEPRGALWAEVQVEERQVQVINAHLGLLGAERVAQARALLGPDWLGRPDCRRPVILTGDFNAPPFTSAYRKIRRQLTAVQDVLSGCRRRATFPSRFPVLALDHVFFDGPIEILDVAIIRTPLAKLASDHLPLVVDFEVTREPLPQAQEEHEPAGAIAALRG
ncbi:MAG TPA: endonuclease/exonuclease/phosphatase family protein [Geminicoccus sp.]|uniref:endonuclease/exonuclease/phosphatase family protein n=1 Tax=Geminicoccus sp. TaxID=2024832 RepID=UPI002E2F6E5E|nr:endonuclease/exonuclease/phosphatase family protein [Geminicoccus sp.]HEX2529007.1 endonuclease/exonuclease/phosphatase family protein [Geminicoccus sp.]